MWLVAQSCVTLCDPIDCSPPRLLRPWDFPGKNTGVDCHFLLQGILPIQGSNPGLPHCRWILYQLSHKGSPLLRIMEDFCSAHGILTLDYLGLFLFFYLPFQPPEDPKFLGSPLCSCCCETLQRRALGVNFISFSCWVSNVPCRHGRLDLSMMGKELIYKTLACVLSHSVMFHSLKPQRP